MEDWRKDTRREAIIVDLDVLMPKDICCGRSRRLWTMSDCMNDLTRTTAMTMAAPEPIRLCL